MDKYECTACGYIYDPAVGDPDNGIPRRNALRGPSGHLGLPPVRGPQGPFRQARLSREPGDASRP